MPKRSETLRRVAQLGREDRWGDALQVLIDAQAEDPGFMVGVDRTGLANMSGRLPDDIPPRREYQGVVCAGAAVSFLAWLERAAADLEEQGD